MPNRKDNIQLIHQVLTGTEGMGLMGRYNEHISGHAIHWHILGHGMYKHRHHHG